MKASRSSKLHSSAITLVLALALGLTTGSSVALAQDSHDHSDAAHAVMELNQGKKWGIDAPLRQGMNAIHADITAALTRIHKGDMSEADYDKLAEDVNTQFVYIVENCNLEPAPDAQLHIVLGNIMLGLDAVKGTAHDQNRSDGVVKIAQTLNTYGSFFEHEGWQTINLAH